MEGCLPSTFGRGLFTVAGGAHDGRQSSLLCLRLYRQCADGHAFIDADTVPGMKDMADMRGVGCSILDTRHRQSAT
jgi:hypothetical protein